MSRESYDLIANVYATDMGQNMAFDDIGYYRRLCLARGGRTLELGCGTGRILLPLLQGGVDIRGVDQSPGMLAQLLKDAQQLNLQPEIMLGTLSSFEVVPYHTLLAPYSVVTYVTDAEQLQAFFHRAARSLDDSGLLVIDTFVPRPVTSFSDFRLDYRRPHHDQVLQREKRITTVNGCNRIERRYTLLAANGEAVKSWTTVDVIRPWREEELVRSAAATGLQLVTAHGNFSEHRADDEQFVILHFAAVRG